MDDRTMPLLIKEKIERESSKEKDLEETVKEHVLPFLPAKSLCKFQCVSKKWYQRITSPFLAHQQSYYYQNLSGFLYQRWGNSPTFMSLNHAAHGIPTPILTFLPEQITIVDSCNGLLLCHGYHSNTYYICNPATKKWQELPEPTLFHGHETSTLLAFSPSPMNMVPHYKLISVVPILNYPLVQFEMYTNETGSWRVSETLCMQELTLTSNRFYLNGVAYWETYSRKVLAFDLSNEFYEIIPLQDETPPNGVLTQIWGELCYIAITKEEDLGTEHHVMIYGGMDLSLKRTTNVKIEQGLYPIQLASEYRLLPCLDGEVVMILIGNYIFSYSLREEKVTVVRHGVPAFVYSAHKFLTYVNSLVNVA